MKGLSLIPFRESTIVNEGILAGPLIGLSEFSGGLFHQAIIVSISMHVHAPT